MVATSVAIDTTPVHAHTTQAPARSAHCLCSPHNRALIIEGSFFAASRNWRTALGRSATGYSHQLSHSAGSGAGRGSAAGGSR